MKTSGETIKRDAAREFWDARARFLEKAKRAERRERAAREAAYRETVRAIYAQAEGR